MNAKKSILTIILCALTAVIPMSGRAQNVDKLHVEGTQLVNSKGEPVVLHGISFGWHCIWPQFWNKQCTRYLIRNWNAQVVRASMGVAKEAKGEMLRNYLAEPKLGLKCVKHVVDEAIRDGAYVIIDWHSHDIFEEQAISFFRMMAKRYKGVPNVIYEVYNEPDYETWPEVKAYATKVIRAIREIEPDAVILVGCPHWDQDIDQVAADPIRGEKNLMYTMHFYAGTHKQWLRDRTDAAMAKGIPVFVSECAGMEASGDGPIDAKEWQAFVDWMAARKISWCAWSVSDKVETCSMFIPGANPKGRWKEDEVKPWGKMVRAALQGNQ